jgi:hypothetical protein
LLKANSEDEVLIQGYSLPGYQYKLLEIRVQGFSLPGYLYFDRGLKRRVEQNSFKEADCQSKVKEHGFKQNSLKEADCFTYSVFWEVCGREDDLKRREIVTGEDVVVILTTELCRVFIH